MKTIIQKIDKGNFGDRELEEAVRIIGGGGLVAFPTETVYGLGGNAFDDRAASKIYEAKGRPSDNPLIIHIGQVEDLEQLTFGIPEKAKLLADAFWPGPLTMIFNKSEKVPFSITGGLDTVAVRMPQHPVALALIRQSQVGIAAPSANTSGKPSPTLAQHVIEDLDGKIDMIIDCGLVGIGIESTIVDMTTKLPVILRPGYITKAMLEDIIGKVQMDEETSDFQSTPKAPGMKYKHYAPKGDLIIVEGNSHIVIKEINKRAQQLIEQGNKVGVIATKETKQAYEYGIVKEIGSRNNEESIARRLYSVLREFDNIGVAYIFTESFESDRLGYAIMNRLLKAAGHHVINVDEGV
jgi:L-threonylcarbamoyladenylate synthase